MNPGILFHTLMLLLVLSVSSCKKNNDKDTTDRPGNTPAGKLMFHLHTYLDNNEVDAYNIVYTMDDGRKISLDLAQLYVSDIRMVKPDGSEVALTGKRILKLREVETYLAGDVPVGNYKSVRFRIGLDPATNLLSPSDSSDSTLLNRPEMWFGSNAQPDGYVFMNLEGKIDTTADASGTVPQMQPFAYKIGTNANYVQVNMPDKNFTVIRDQVEFVHVLIDYYTLFSGIDLSDPANLIITTLSGNANEPAPIIVANMPLMFEYEE